MIGQSIFFIEGKVACFKNFELSTSPWVLKKWCYNLNHLCQTTLRRLLNSYMMSAIAEIGEKIDQIFFQPDVSIIYEQFRSINFIGPEEMIL